ncbi:MAG: hypothetical protein ACYS8W_05090 [Planctomycetota bacterium]|jgi:hypothetical protein
MDIMSFGFASPSRGLPDTLASYVGGTVTGRVVGISIEGQPLINLMGTTFPAAIPFAAEEGTLVQFTVIIQEGKGLTLTPLQPSAGSVAEAAAPPRTITTALADLGLQASGENVAIFEALSKAGVPASLENIEIVRSTASRAPVSFPEAVQAAAYLLKKEMPVTPRTAAAIAELTRPVEATAHALGEAAASLEEVTLPDADRSKAARLVARGMRELHSWLDAASTPRSLEKFVRDGGIEQIRNLQARIEAVTKAVLASDPALSELRSAVEAASRLVSNLGESAAPTADGGGSTLPEALRSMIQVPRPDANGIIVMLKGLEPPALRKAHSMLIEREAQEITRYEIFRPLARAHGELERLTDRFSVIKTLNAASVVAAEDIAYTQILVAFGAAFDMVRLRFHIGRKKDEKDSPDTPRKIIMDLSLSHLGDVLGEVVMDAQNVVIGFIVDDEPTKVLFDQRAYILLGVLKELGYDTEVRTAVRDKEEKRLFLEDFGEPGDFRVVDIVI